MKDISIPDAMDLLWKLEKDSSPMEAADRIAAEASLMPRSVAIVALSRLYSITSAQARHAAARLASAEAALELAKDPRI